MKRSIPGNRQFDHRQAVFDADAQLSFMRRVGRRDEQHAVQIERGSGVLGQHEMPDVRRIERAAENAYPLLLAA